MANSPQARKRARQETQHRARNMAQRAAMRTHVKKYLKSIDGSDIEVAEKEDRIIISKDSDFYKYYLIHGIPKRILFITTGNIINKELLRLFELNFEAIENYFLSGSKIIEFNNSLITVYS